jgi:hypothetical protein
MFTSLILMESTACFGICFSLIYRTKESEKSLYTIPTAKEYFLDLEFILSVISEGKPTRLDTQAQPKALPFDD